MINFSKTEFLKSAALPKDIYIGEAGEIAMCGRSNVGKSTLINKLCNRKSLARTSSTPGKTTTINYYRIKKDFYITDLPGYGFARRSQSERRRWADLMESYFRNALNIRLALLLLDVRHEPSSDDITMINFLVGSNLPFMAVMTKSDKPKKSELSEKINFLNEYMEKYSPIDSIAVSIKDSKAIDKLRNSISDYLEI
ncbi:MAG: YihA family ribosome biogenesis GTP-binding protein [Ruminococcaceae bacterium]|nr:YihA family ribosome biogenesis GTP-binding protein [Oscillospiraceae bacterium]